MSDPPHPAMSPERWQEVKAAVAEALGRTPAERAAYLDRVCGGDAELRREMESLLAASDAAGDFLARPAIEELELQATADSDAALPARLAALLGDRYALEGELGGGGMARVFVATERALDRRVVIKLLRPDLAAGLSVDRFKREIAFAARLQHANIVPLLSAGEADGLPYYTMPFVEGRSLRARLEQDGEMDMSEVVAVLRDVARALAYAHAHGVVHRDIKPDNVLIAGGAAVVTDFGIAKALSAARTTIGGPKAHGSHATLTQVGTTLGTPAYMAPEQAAGDSDVDEHADVYALGCTAYELLTGRPPFRAGSTPRLLAAHVFEQPVPVTDVRPAVPLPLAATVMRCLEKDPAARPSAADVARSLDAGVPTGSTPASVDTTPLPAVAADGSARRRRLALLGGLLAMAAAAPLVARVGRSPSSVAEGPRTLAVLPLGILGGDTANAYFASGLADELTNALARIEGLRVTPPTAVGTADTLGNREIARRLGVAALLDGSVQRAGERLRVRVRLVSGEGGHVLWSHEYDRPVTDVFAMQADIADSVAASLRVTLNGATQARVASASGTRNADAYLLYLEGRYAAAQYTEPDLRRAVALYGQAIERDSAFARAWAGAADAWASLAGEFLPPHEALPPARAAARRALALDATLAESHIALGNVLLLAWDAAGAAAAFERAVALDPDAASAHYYAASALLPLGRVDGALDHASTAHRLDPAQPAYLTAVAVAHLRAGRHDSAATVARRAFALDSTFTHALTVLGDALRLRGAPREALDAYARRGPAQTAYDLVGPALARVALGQPEEARRTITELMALGSRQHAPDDVMAMIHAHLGAHDRAFAALERAYAARSAGLVSLATDPDWAPLRDDPRFTDLVRRVAGR